MNSPSPGPLLPPALPTSPFQFQFYELLEEDPTLGRVLWFSYKLSGKAGLLTDQVVVGAVREGLELMTIDGQPNVCVWILASGEPQALTDNPFFAFPEACSEVLIALDNYWHDPLATCS